MSYSVEDIVNMALNSIGYTKQIGDIYEGSAAARVALAYYGQTRDELIQSGDWPFAFCEEALVAFTDLPPPSPWLFEYLYPANCLRIRYIRPGPTSGGVRSTDPQPVLYRPWYERRGILAFQAILCDLSPAVLVYQERVLDPSTWTTNFTRALVGALAKKLAFGLFKGADLIKARVELAEMDKMEALTVDDLTAPKGAASGNQR